MKNVMMTCAAALLLTACASQNFPDVGDENTSQWLDAKPSDHAYIDVHQISAGEFAALSAELRQMAPYIPSPQKRVALVRALQDDTDCEVWTVEPRSKAQADKVCGADWSYQNFIEPNNQRSGIAQISIDGAI